MNLFKRFLLLILCALPSVAGAQVASTMGSNLTAYNPTGPSVGNNEYNSMMNVRSTVSGGGATANFGNCNSLILRCAQPKCSGCTSMEIARPIVSGCVNSISECKQYGNDLIEYISGQMVSTVSARIQQQQAAADVAAAQAAAQQNSAEMQALQQQLSQMQNQMAQQNAQSEQIARLQADLEAQRAATASAQQAAADAAAAQAQQQQTSVRTVSASQQAAIDAGVSDDVLLRQQIGGQILTKVENAEMALKDLKNFMDDAFKYAGCDSRGNNCAAPKRVKIFKQKATMFFDPYAEVVDEMYSALEMALAVGVDVSDVIMMLSGSCNQWGRFLCDVEGSGDDAKHQPIHYDNDRKDCVDFYTGSNTSGSNTSGSETSICNSCINGRSQAVGQVKGGHECTPGAAVPPQDDARCTLLELIDASKDGDDAVRREWLSESYEGDRMIRVGCATSALDNIKLFAGRSKARAAMLDLETLERMINQDAMDSVSSNRWSTNINSDLERVKYCGLTEKGFQNLQNAINKKRLNEKDVCITSDKLRANAFDFVRFINTSDTDDKGIINGYGPETCEKLKERSDCGVCWDEVEERCYYDKSQCDSNLESYKNDDDCKKRGEGYTYDENNNCCKKKEGGTCPVSGNLCQKKRTSGSGGDSDE